MISYDKVGVKMYKYFLNFKLIKRQQQILRQKTSSPYRHVSPITTLAKFAMSARLQRSPKSTCQPDYNARQTHHVSPITTFASLTHSAPLWFQYRRGVATYVLSVRNKYNQHGDI
jgi:hypothetical protein